MEDEWRQAGDLKLADGVRRATGADGKPLLVTAEGRYVAVSPASTPLIDLLQTGCSGHEIFAAVRMPRSDRATTERGLNRFLDDLRQSGVLNRAPIVQSSLRSSFVSAARKDFFKKFPLSRDADRRFSRIGSAVARWRLAPLAWTWVVISGAALVYALVATSTPHGHPGFGLVAVAVVLIITELATHECSHAIVMSTLGVPIREVGIGLLYYFAPVAYVDRTHTYELRSRTGRVMIALAGPLTDCLWLAAWAVLSRLTQGEASDLFSMLVSAQLLLLAANLNPLFRSDGYQALEAAFGSVNMRSRAISLVSHRMLRMPLPSYLLVLSTRVRVGYWIYSILSVIYLALLAALFVRTILVLLPTAAFQ